VNNIRSTLSIVWRIAAPYFWSEDKWAGRGLLASVVAIELSLVGIDVLINQWNNRFYNALQDRNWDNFMREIGIFTILAFCSIGLAVYQVYLNQWLQIRWRRWLTSRYLGAWLNDSNHYRMQLQGDAADNPDQRISDDLRLFVDLTLEVGLNLLNAVVTILSFVVILWGLSQEAPLQIYGRTLAIPGYLVWSALIYAVIGTILTQWIGSPLVNLNFQQQRFEADFRFSLVRVRENSEQIALLKGEDAEREQLSGRFSHIVANWYGIMNRTKRLTAFTTSYAQAAVIFPVLLLAPAYFADKIQLGAMVQAANAFEKVRKALSVFVEIYRTLAQWRAVIARLDGFELAIARALALASTPPTIDISAEGGGNRIDLADLLVKLPNGAPLISAKSFSINRGERMLLSGPTGAGKSTLFRAIAGIWPFGSGAIAIPANASLMMLPQRPYFPVGTLKAAAVYPASDSAFAADKVRDVLISVGLPKLADRLDHEAHWNRMLSLGEQQRLGLARALLQAPDFLFLDEATASLDEASETELYRLLEQRLPGTTVVSIGHRSTLTGIHQRNVALVADGPSFALKNASEGAMADAAAGGGAGGRRNQTE
jgi:vitamin B12/bleomycin/antimicrobial peptide transport system ATP-binding/permease protein